MQKAIFTHVARAAAYCGMISCCATIGMGCSCQPVWYVDDEGCAVGDVVVEDGDDLKKINGIACFRNALELRGDVLGIVNQDTFVGVQEIGDLFIHSDYSPKSTPGDGKLVFPDLVKIPLLVLGKSPYIRYLSLPRIETMQIIVLEDADDVTEVAFDSLVEVTECLNINGCSNLKTLKMDKLQKVGTAYSPCVEFQLRTSAIDPVSFPLLAKVDGDMVIEGMFGPITVMPDGSISSPGAVLEFPELSNVSISVQLQYGKLKSISMPKLVSTGNFHIREEYESLDGLALEWVSFMDISPGQIGTYEVSIPNLKRVFVMKVYGTRPIAIRMPKLEQLNTLVVDQANWLREVDLPAIKCLQEVETRVDFTMFMCCLLPEAFDAAVAASLANGCTTTLNINDPRSNPYHPYDAAACNSHVPE